MWCDMNRAEFLLYKFASDPAFDRASEIFLDYLTVPKHVVRPGEVLSSVARRYGVGLGELMEFNGMTGPLALKPGQIVRIPPNKGRPTTGRRQEQMVNGAGPWFKHASPADSRRVFPADHRI